MIAVAIDPNAALAELPGELSQEDDPAAALLAELRAQPVATAVPDAETAAAPARPATPPTRPGSQPARGRAPAFPFQLRAALEPALGLGNLPGPGAGLLLGIGVAFGDLALWLRGMAWLPQEEVAREGASVSVGTLLKRLRPPGLRRARAVADLPRDGVFMNEISLQYDVEGRAMLLVSRGSESSSSGKGLGELLVFDVGRPGEVAASSSVQTGTAWLGPCVLLADDAIVSRTALSSDIEISRYRRDELLWRQTRIASIPDQPELGVSFPEDTPLDLLAVAADRRERTWAVLFEGVLGIAQIDPDGVVGWHGLLPWDPSTSQAKIIAIDGRDRPILGFSEQVVRIEPDESDEERSKSLVSAPLYDNFYSPEVHALAVDAQDRILVATHDGTRAARHVVVDRISEDFGERVRFVLDLPAADAQGSHIHRLHVGPTGDVYALVVSTDSLAARTRILRLHLVEP